MSLWAGDPGRGTSFDRYEDSFRERGSLVPSVCSIGHVGKEILEHMERFGAVEG